MILLVHGIPYIKRLLSLTCLFQILSLDPGPTRRVCKGFRKRFHLVWQLPQIIQETPVYRVVEFSASFTLVSGGYFAVSRERWLTLPNWSFGWWISLSSLMFSPCFFFSTAGPLRLGPPSNQVGLGGGRLPEERRSQPRGGSSADASSERLQHPQDRDGRHARLHGADRGPVPCSGRPQEERPRVWEARQGIHPGSQAAGGGQFCTKGI